MPSVGHLKLGETSMATKKKRSRIAQVQARVAPRPRRRAGARGAPGRGEYDHTELVALVCNYFAMGYLPSRIQALLRKEHGIWVSREAPYRYLAYAAERGWIRFDGPPEHNLRERLKNEHPWLQGAEVAHTAVFEDVAHHAAKMILGLLRKYTQPPYNKKEVHIGFAGGHAMRTVAKHLARLLREPAEGLPETVVFHAMVAGFEPEDPTTAPNAFFTYFENDPALQVKTRLVGLLSPPIVRCDQFADLQELAGIEVSFSLASEVDIIVTSATSWDGDCRGMLREYMEQSPESIEALERAGVCGDMLWRPLGKDGPIEIETKIRAMTLMELSDLAGFIEQGKSVMLVIGPCRVCHDPRPKLLKTLLQLKEHLITHVAVDSRSVAEFLRGAVSAEAPLAPAGARPGNTAANPSRRRPQ
jgi:DNA-binding transcriptional regulator LsrR (DeoR family)